MEVSKAIEARRAYRSLDPVEVTDGLVMELGTAASLAPSCFNKQPWRYVFVRDRERLEEVFGSLSRGNEWFRSASLVVGVFSQKGYDCVVGRREYFLFDTGMATGLLLLRATELGLVAHPIAGFDEDAAKKAMRIPGDALLITIIAVGRHSASINPVLSGHQVEAETVRPPRLEMGDVARIDSWEPAAFDQIPPAADPK
jgi:nitroreductase